MKKFFNTNANGDDDADELRFMAIDERRFYCPLRGELMTDPVLTPTGKSFERKALSEWMRRHGERCPLSGKAIDVTQIKSNFHLQWEILFWQRQRQAWYEVPSDCKPSSATNKRRRMDTSILPRRDIVQFQSANCMDSPPTRPRRRGSGSGGTVDPDLTVQASPRSGSSLPIPSGSSRSDSGINSSCRMCALPLRTSSFPSMNKSLFDGSMVSYDGDDHDMSDTMSFGKLFALLDEAIQIAEQDDLP